jgi:glycosyltransferase involved in cell wall biosynthesis
VALTNTKKPRPRRFTVAGTGERPHKHQNTPLFEYKKEIQKMKLSVVMPVYNESATLKKVVEQVLSVPLEIELICVDDGSRDGSVEILKELQRQYPQIKIALQPKNMGKGAALRRGIQEATGLYVVIQDADLEYDPSEYPILLNPLMQGEADVVYGSRFLGGHAHRVLYFWHSVGNWLLTLFSNILTNVNLTDMETCYKMFRREVIQSIPIEENRFGFEPEITVKIAKRRLRIYEVGISYWGRTYEEGKKIGWKDGMRALWCLLKYSIKERRLKVHSSGKLENALGDQSKSQVSDEVMPRR